MINSSELFKQILCGGTLSDKLLGSDLGFERVSWSANPLQMDEVPVLPERRFTAAPIKSFSEGFPKKTKLILETEEGYRERGRLLHYFANHELLAIETMALTLLRFPEAPLEFKKGVLKTLQDEQRHLSHYLNRMSDYGVQLGDVPFSFYFWNRLRDIKTPLDFVVRMSMTFEQANLDFALEFATLFETEMDDPKTASLLRTIHDDEVKHVGHGVKWFQTWNEPSIHEKGEWEAYLEKLPYPLNARRAKGSAFFSAASRLSAGLSREYVDSIRIAGGSRGRVPDYYFYNPECEIEKINPDLNKTLIEKREDLAPLMLWLAHSEDRVELPRPLSIEFRKQVFEIRGELPDLILESNAVRSPASSEEWIESLKPWGWGNRAWERQDRWKKRIRQSPPFSKDRFEKDWFSKSFWKQFSEGTVIHSRAELEGFIEQHANSDQTFIFKHSFSTSGRGHVVFQPSSPDEELRKLLHKKRSRNQELTGVIEPFYAKVADFSIQYEILSLPGGNKIKRYDPRFFEVDDQLQYRGAILGPLPSDHPKFSAWLAVDRNRAEILAHHQRVLDHLMKEGYVGPIGIDALVAQQGTELRVVPLIEVNVRYTMGRVAAEIEGYLRKKGIPQSGHRPPTIRFYSLKDLREKGLKDFKELPAFWPRDSFYPLTPVEDAKSTWVVLHFDC